MSVPLLAAAALCLLLLGTTNSQQVWSNFNCPAPRSPKNGLSFIFQQGKEVHFKCHPGFTLVGSHVAKCLNNQWDSPVPDCITDKGEKNVSGVGQTEDKSSSARLLFSWDNPNISHVPSESEIVAGSRRLPLINGLWKSNNEKRERANEHPNSASWTPGRLSPSSNKTRSLYSQEMSIAEVRQRQQEEMLSNSILRGSDNFPRGPSSRDLSRQHNSDAADRRRWRIVQARQSPNVLYAGSRAASAHRGQNYDDDLDTEESIMGIFNWAEAPRELSEVHAPPPQPLPTSHRPEASRARTEVHGPLKPLLSVSHRSELSNEELIEMRQRQIAEALLNQMASNLPRGRNSDKAGLIEDARRRQYEELQLLRFSPSLQKPMFKDNYKSNKPLQNLESSTNLSDDDYLLASGAEVHEKIANPNEDLSTNVLKPVFEDQMHIFKPSYYEGDGLNSATSANSLPSRGDMGVLYEHFTENPEVTEYTEQHPRTNVPETSYRLQISDSKPSIQRATFSDEKAGQVEATIRRFLRPRPQVVIYSEPLPTYVPTYHSNLVPKTTRRPTPTFRPTRRPDYRPPTRAPVMETNGDKAAQTEEAIYQQYLQAEHLRRILEYERERLEWERRQDLDRRNIIAEERRAHSDRRSLLADENESESSINELTQRPDDEKFFSNTSDADLDYANRIAVLTSVDREWLSQLSPDLQSRYLEEILTSRRKESDESHHAEDFLRRHMDNFGSVQNTTFPNVSTRTSASGHVTTIIESKSPASPNSTESSKADLSCLQSRSGRRLFIRAPKVPFAYVYRYEKKKHTRYPFKQYLVAEYRCRRGYAMVPSENDSMFCRSMDWVGVKPHCIKTE